MVPDRRIERKFLCFALMVTFPGQALAKYKERLHLGLGELGLGVGSQAFLSDTPASGTGSWKRG